jgi:hypothetical protein
VSFKDAKILKDIMGQFDLNDEFDKNIHIPWLHLIKGGTIGKRIVIGLADDASPGKVSTLNTVSVQTTAPYACQLCLTIQAPKFITNSAAVAALLAAGNIQEASGEIDNQQRGFPNFEIGNPSVTIDWGIGGVSDTVEADISNGLCLNFCASFLRVTPNISTFNLDDVAGGAYVLSAFVGPGSPKTINGQKTVTVAPFTDVGISALYPVPKYAKTVSLIGIQFPTGGSPGSGAAFSGKIQFFRNSVADINSMIGETTFDETTHYSVNVPNGAIFFAVVNTTTQPGGGATTRATPIFDLAI